MLRKQIRERKEYLFRKAAEANDAKRQEQKQSVSSALKDRKKITGVDDIKKSTVDMIYDQGIAPQDDIRDDEYANAGIRDPKILITTSRDPSGRLLQFAKELRLLFPNSQRINRGNHIMSEIVKVCAANDVTDLIIAHEHRGTPNGLIISHFPHGPTAFFSLHNVTLRHDIKEANQGHVSEAYPHLIFSGLSTKVGNRLKTILKYLYPVPKEDSQRVVSFVNQNDFISFRHHTFDKQDDEIVMKEQGPRFEMKPYQIRLGLVDFEQADTEWVLRSYTNTAHKKTNL